MFNKKSGQIGETITWVVATVIIVVILLISIFVSTSFFKKNKSTDSLSKQSDLLASKSFFAYLLTENEGQTIYEQLKRDGNFIEFNGELALDVFKGLYEKDYWLIWSVVYSKPNDITHNEYFPKPPPCGAGIWDEIELEENKYILLTLTKSC